MQSRLLPVAIVACTLMATALLTANQAVSSGPQPGQEVPSPLPVLNATGEWAGKYHCPVCEAGLNSAVLIFVREVPQPGQPMMKLLQGLDAAITERPGSPAAATAIFLGDGGYKEALGTKIDDKARVNDLRLTKAILFKDAKVAQLSGLLNEAKLKHVLLAIASEDDVKDYRLDKAADITVVGYSRHKTLVNKAYAKDQLTEAEAGKLLTELTTNLPNVAVPKY